MFNRIPARLPGLILGAAAVSLAYLLLVHEHRSTRVRRTYRFRDAGEGFDLVNEVIDQEHEQFGVESSMQLVGDTATVRTSRRGHEVITNVLLSRRLGQLEAVAA